MTAPPNGPIRVIDSHTGGEPTRVVISGVPDLGSGDMAQRRARFAKEHDAWRRAIVNEPRGSDVIVGALLCEPLDRASTCGVIFFNNVGVIGMCGHGTIGLVATLAYLDRIEPGEHRIETPVGPVTTTLHDDGTVTVANVPSYRHATHVKVDVPGHGAVHGDVAWGGNWFFLCHDHGLELEVARIGELTDFATQVRRALRAQGVTGRDGAEIDHVELMGRPADPANDARNFVLCPGRGLRSLTLRHRHEREARVSRGRRQARCRCRVAAGEHHRQRVHGPVRSPRATARRSAGERRAARDPRSRACHARRHRDHRSRRRVRVGHRVTSM